MDGQAGTDLVRFQWEAIHSPARFTPPQSDEDGAWAGDAELFVEAIEQIRCDRLSGIEKVTFDFFHNISQKNGELRFSTTLLDGQKYGTFEVTGECISSHVSEEINIQNIYKVDNVVYIGDPTGCRIKIKLSKTDVRQPDANEQSLNLLSYLTINSSDYDIQQLRKYVEISQYSYENMIASLVKTNSCIFVKMDANWRYYFLDKICKQAGTITVNESVCVNDLLSTISSEVDAKTIIDNLRSDTNDKLLMKRIGRFESIQFSNIASGMSHMFYLQNKSDIVQAGKHVTDENFFVWDPFGSQKENYQALVNDPSIGNYFNWIMSASTNTYSNFFESEGSFRIHLLRNYNLGWSSLHYDFYLDPLSTVTVYFGSPNKYVNVTDYTVVMPGILWAWIIEQGDKQTNATLMQLGFTAATFAFNIGALASSTTKAWKVINTILLVKGFSDKIILSGNEDFNKLIPESFLIAYENVSNVINVSLFFKDIFDRELDSKISILVEEWEKIDSASKQQLKSNHLDIFTFLDSKISELKR